MLIFLALALAVGTFARFYWVSWIGERVVTDIRRKVFSHLIYLSPGFFEHNRSMEIQSRLTADTTLIQSVIGSSVSIALRNLLMLFGGIIWLFITNAKLTLIVMLCVPLVVAPILIYGRRVRALSRKNQDRIADVGSAVGESLTFIKSVQAYNRQSLNIERFNDVAETAFQVALKRITQRSWLISIVIVLVLSAIAAMLWLGGNDVISGRMSGGELAAFLFYSILVGSAVGSISEVISELQRAAGALERIAELLTSESQVVDTTMEASANTPNQSSPSIPAPVFSAISIRDVSFSYASRPERRAIQNVSLDIVAGETIALVGPSGAGKSTLVDLLLRFYDPQAGSLTINGTAYKDLSLNALRSNFALVSQSPELFYATIRDNICYANPEATEQEVTRAAKAAHAHEFITELPHGYDTHRGDIGLGLSGGQKQRIAIARALLSKAPVLLLDEATSALDAQSEKQVQDALDKLVKTRTSIIIAHRLATIKNADRIAVIDQGALVALGTHAELVRTNKLYKKLADLQFKTAAAPTTPKSPSM